MAELLKDRKDGVDTVSKTKRAAQGLSRRLSVLDEVYNDDSAVRALALHLACTDDFQRVMAMEPWNLGYLILQEEWAATVYLPGKSNRFKDNKSWILHYRQKSYGRQVLKAAMQLYDELPRSCKTAVWEDITAPSPSFTATSIELREDIFRYHELRQHLQSLGKQCARHQYAIKREKTIAFLISNSETQQRTLSKLFHLQEAELECHNRLSSTTFETVVIEALDRLISNFKQQTSLGCLDETTGPDKPPYSQASALLMERHTFTPRYTVSSQTPLPFSTKRSTKNGIPRRGRKLPLHLDVPLRHDVVSATISLHRSLIDHEVRLARHVPLIFDEIDNKRFNANVQDLLSVNARLPHVITQKSC